MRFTMKPILRPVRLGLLLAGLAGASAPSWAAGPSPSDRETARALLDSGKAALAAKNYSAALKAYSAAYSLVQVPTTGLGLGKAQAGSGQLIEARDTLLWVTRHPSAPGEPEVFGAARTEADQLAKALAERIPSVKLQISGPPAEAALKVSIDGVPVPEAAATLPRKVNPGTHKITVGALGFDSSTVEVTLQEKEEKTVPVTLQAAPRSVAAAPAAPASSSAQPDPGAAPPAEKSSTLVYVGFGVGGVGILVGTITGLMSMSKTSGVKDKCSGNVCPTSSQGDIDSAHTLATISNVSFALGIVGAGVGVYGLLSAGGSGGSTAVRPKPVDLAVGPGSVHVLGTFLERGLRRCERSIVLLGSRWPFSPRPAPTSPG
jgi:hypothetical protein